MWLMPLPEKRKLQNAHTYLGVTDSSQHRLFSPGIVVRTTLSFTSIGRKQATLKVKASEQTPHYARYSGKALLAFLLSELEDLKTVPQILNCTFQDKREMYKSYV